MTIEPLASSTAVAVPDGRQARGSGADRDCAGSATDDPPRKQQPAPADDGAAADAPPPTPSRRWRPTAAARRRGPLDRRRRDDFAVRLMDGAAVTREIAPVGVGEQVDTGEYASTQTGLFYVNSKIEDLAYDPPYDTYISHWVGFDPDKANGFHSFLKDANGNVVDAAHRPHQQRLHPHRRAGRGVRVRGDRHAGVGALVEIRGWKLEVRRLYAGLSTLRSTLARVIGRMAHDEERSRKSQERRPRRLLTTRELQTKNCN